MNNIRLVDGIIKGYFKNDFTYYLIETKTEILTDNIEDFIPSDKYYTIIKSFKEDNFDKLIKYSFNNIDNSINKCITLITDGIYIYALIINGEMVILNNYAFSINLPNNESIILDDYTLSKVLKYDLDYYDFIYLIKEKINDKKLQKTTYNSIY